MKLPVAFLKKMEEQLGTDFPCFLESYKQPRTAGVRANRIKISPEALQKILPFLEERVPWCPDGFYYSDEAVRLAKSPYYYAGLYYIQEPSAMLPAELLKACPGERVLDLCAAPGGKSLQLAAQIGRTGLLVSNDINLKRAKVLLKNVERYGIVNALVLNETPQRLSEVFRHFFDKILVDAPCSGEGMFRKEPEMAKDWTEEAVEKYVRWQEEILNVVPYLLRPGGEVVYSTCTFSLEEDEFQIRDFLSKFSEFKLDTMQKLWPHEVRGEGHFAAKLTHTVFCKNSLCANGVSNSKHKQANQSISKETFHALERFSQQVWGDSMCWQEWLPPGGNLVEREGHILYESCALPPLKGLKVLRSGWLLGTIEKGRFRPSPAFALGLPSQAVARAVQVCNFSGQDFAESAMAVRYLRGETLQKEETRWNRGWHLVAIDGFPLGWAKGEDFWLKNEYPPGWRWGGNEEW